MDHSSLVCGVSCVLVPAAQGRACLFLQDLAQHPCPAGLQALLKSELVIGKANELGRAE